MAFERYVRGGRIYKPMASIWPRGQIGFNRGAIECYKIHNYKFAVLFFDRETQRIGIQLTNDAKEEGVTAAIKGKSCVTISAVSFLDHFDIEHDTTRKYAVEFDAESDMYIIDTQRAAVKNRPCS